MDTTWVHGSQYNVSNSDGTPIVNRTQATTGKVVVVTAPTNYTPATGTRLTILRNEPLTQAASYTEQGPFPAKAHERALDRLEMQIHTLADKLNRAPVFKETSTNSGLILPEPFADRIIGWNSGGTALENKAWTDLQDGLYEVVDEDDMASDSDTKVPTQQSVKAYADTKITGSTGGVDGVMLVADGTGGKTAKAHASGAPGTAAFKNTGTSGDAVPLLNAANTWSAAQSINVSAFGAPLQLLSTDAGAFGLDFNLIHLSPSPAANDTLARLVWYGRDAALGTTNYAVLQGVVLDTTDGSEDGALVLSTMLAGAVGERMRVAGGVFHPSATGTDKGNNTLNFGQLWYNGVQLSPPGSPVTKTADFTVAASEQHLINNKAAASCTVTLPTASSFPGRKLTIKNLQAFTVVSASSNVVPLGTAVAGTAILSANAGRWATLVSDGTNWIIMAGVV